MERLKEELDELIFGSLSEVRSDFSRMVEEASLGKKVIISVHGKPKAVLIGFEDYRRLEELIELLEDRYLEERTKERLAASSGRTLPLEEVEQLARDGKL